MEDHWEDNNSVDGAFDEAEYERPSVLVLTEIETVETQNVVPSWFMARGACEWDGGAALVMSGALLHPSVGS